MKTLGLSLVLAILCSGCGVKLPPVAPESNPEPSNLNLNCSPNDPECDAQDPNYKATGK